MQVMSLEHVRSESCPQTPLSTGVESVGAGVTAGTGGGVGGGVSVGVTFPSPSMQVFRFPFHMHPAALHAASSSLRPRHSRAEGPPSPPLGGSVGSFAGIV